MDDKPFDAPWELDTIDGLKSELDDALEMLWQHGGDKGRSYILHNYPNFPDKITPIKE